MMRSDPFICGDHSASRRATGIDVLVAIAPNSTRPLREISFTSRWRAIGHFAEIRRSRRTIRALIQFYMYSFTDTRRCLAHSSTTLRLTKVTCCTRDIARSAVFRSMSVRNMWRRLFHVPHGGIVNYTSARLSLNDESPIPTHRINR